MASALKNECHHHNLADKSQYSYLRIAAYILIPKCCLDFPVENIQSFNVWTSMPKNSDVYLKCNHVVAVALGEPNFYIFYYLMAKCHHHNLAEKFNIR